jgi:hypothetical protein
VCPGDTDTAIAGGPHAAAQPGLNGDDAQDERSGDPHGDAADRNADTHDYGPRGGIPKPRRGLHDGPC